MNPTLDEFMALIADNLAEALERNDD